MKSLLGVFKRGLRKTATSVSRGFGGIFRGVKAWDESVYECLEAALIGADFGVAVSTKLVDEIRERYKLGTIATESDIFQVARERITEILRDGHRSMELPPGQTTVIMMVGVNGSGKTTTAGKLATLWRGEGRKPMLAACDTFRAAAVEQLKLWGERSGGTPVITSIPGADPAAVAFDATQSAVAKKVDALLIDTAGRQHTKKGLMEELGKMRRSIAKACPGAPHEVWLTIDASMGANVLAQARQFNESVGLTGLVITKLDGSGKGGMAVGLRQELGLPIFFAGFGESPEDLQPFSPEFYAEALFPTEE